MYKNINDINDKNDTNDILNIIEREYTTWNSGELHNSLTRYYIMLGLNK